MTAWGCRGCGTGYRLRITRCPRCHGTDIQEGPVLLICDDCTTRYAVGLDRCPHCGSTDRTEEGEQQMPKIRRDGEPKVTVAGEPGPEVEQLPAGQPVDAERERLDDDTRIAVADSDEQNRDQDDELEGGEQPSAGSNSSASTGRQPSSKQNKASGRKPAPTTENHSGADPKVSSTAPSMGGSGTD